MAETPHYSHFVAPLFLGSAIVIFVCVIVGSVAAFRKAGRVTKFTAAGAALMVIGYSVLLFGVALASGDKTLPLGSRKYFCELDCHIAYSIESTQGASTLGPESKPITAQGRFVVVRLKTWFDEKSIAPFRGNGPLAPNPRVVFLVDDRGCSYQPAPQAAAALQVSSTPLDRTASSRRVVPDNIYLRSASGCWQPKAADYRRRSGNTSSGRSSKQPAARKNLSFAEPKGVRCRIPNSLSHFFSSS